MSLAIPTTTLAASQADGVTCASKPAQSPANSKTSAPKDSVQASTAALTAIQEAQATHSHTVHEARHGDQQAARLLAREAAKKA
ncbi:MAG: hypothetical protein WCE61_14600 [Candidatus Acidiferrum sp.]